MPLAASETRVLFHDSAIALGAISNLIITDTRGAAQREHIAEIARAFRAAERTYPGRLVALAIVRAGAPPGDSASRAEAAKLLETFSGALRQISVVIDGTGIWAGTMRTVLRGMSIVARTPYAMKVHADLADATRSLVPLMIEVNNQRPTERDVLDAVQRVRDLPATSASTPRSASG